MRNSISSTDVSLLARLQQTAHDEVAWYDFVDRYGSRIFQWCEIRGLQPNDAEDVTQQVLIRMSRYLRNFEYNASLSFRAYLRRATENSITDFLSSRNGRERPGGGTEMMNWMASVEARNELADRLKDVFDAELLEHAMFRVQQRVNDQRWQAWYQTAVKQRDSREVAQELGIGIATLYSARNQVGNLVRDEIQLLENPESGAVGI
ncbi:MAG: sigma-70 family RNA polymerase sigma factor [Planctomycetaceae bacterium]|nr:sigma-70 family RNA polymerase sigma factor [Planctomycetaceae bacterium]